MKTVLRFLLLVTLAVSLSSVIAQNNRLQIVASHSILGDIVSQVIGDVADVTITMPRGADPHSFQAVPSDLVALADADIVFINGAFYEEGLLEAIENAGSDMNIVTVSLCVEMLAFDGDTHENENDVLTEGIASLCEQHIAEIEVSGTTQYDFETLGRLYEIDCQEVRCDPHVWMQPENVMLWTLLIRDTLIELDPTNAELYYANATSYIEAVSAFTNDFMLPMLETVPEDNRILVTNHDTLGYFAEAYDFEIISTIISGGSTLSEPSAADIAGIIDLIRETGASAIFAEAILSDNLIRQISSETGAEIYLLYTGSLSDLDEPASNYLDYMRYNVTTIVEALGGG